MSPVLEPHGHTDAEADDIRRVGAVDRRTTRNDGESGNAPRQLRLSHDGDYYRGRRPDPPAAVGPATSQRRSGSRRDEEGLPKARRTAVGREDLNGSELERNKIRHYHRHERIEQQRRRIVDERTTGKTNDTSCTTRTERTRMRGEPATKTAAAQVPPHATLGGHGALDRRATERQQPPASSQRPRRPPPRHRQRREEGTLDGAARTTPTVMASKKSKRAQFESSEGTIDTAATSATSASSLPTDAPPPPPPPPRSSLPRSARDRHGRPAAPLRREEEGHEQRRRQRRSQREDRRVGQRPPPSRHRSSSPEIDAAGEEGRRRIASSSSRPLGRMRPGPLTSWKNDQDDDDDDEGGSARRTEAARNDDGTREGGCGTVGGGGGTGDVRGGDIRDGGSGGARRVREGVTTARAAAAAAASCRAPGESDRGDCSEEEDNDSALDNDDAGAFDDTFDDTFDDDDDDADANGLPDPPALPPPPPKRGGASSSSGKRKRAARVRRDDSAATTSSSSAPLSRSRSRRRRRRGRKEAASAPPTTKEVMSVLPLPALLLTSLLCLSALILSALSRQSVAFSTLGRPMAVGGAEDTFDDLSTVGLTYVTLCRKKRKDALGPEDLVDVGGGSGMLMGSGGVGRPASRDRDRALRRMGSLLSDSLSETAASVLDAAYALPVEGNEEGDDATRTRRSGSEDGGVRRDGRPRLGSPFSSLRHGRGKEGKDDEKEQQEDDDAKEKECVVVHIPSHALSSDSMWQMSRVFATLSIALGCVPAVALVWLTLVRFLGLCRSRRGREGEGGGEERRLRRWGKNPYLAAASGSSPSSSPSSNYTLSSSPTYSSPSSSSPEERKSAAASAAAAAVAATAPPPPPPPLGRLVGGGGIRFELPAVRLPPLALSLLLTYLVHSLTFFHFDSEVCRTHEGCTLASGGVMAVVASAAWFLSALGTMYLDVVGRRRADRRRKREEKNKRRRESRRRKEEERIRKKRRRAAEGREEGAPTKKEGEVAEKEEEEEDPPSDDFPVPSPAFTDTTEESFFFEDEYEYQHEDENGCDADRTGLDVVLRDDWDDDWYDEECRDATVDAATDGAGPSGSRYGVNDGGGGLVAGERQGRGGRRGDDGERRGRRNMGHDGTTYVGPPARSFGSKAEA